MIETQEKAEIRACGCQWLCDDLTTCVWCWLFVMYLCRTDHVRVLPHLSCPRFRRGAEFVWLSILDRGVPPTEAREQGLDLTWMPPICMSCGVHAQVFQGFRVCAVREAAPPEQTGMHVCFEFCFVQSCIELLPLRSTCSLLLSWGGFEHVRVATHTSHHDSQCTLAARSFLPAFTSAAAPSIDAAWPTVQKYQLPRVQQ